MGTVAHGTRMTSFEASPFSAYAIVRFLEAEARSRGEDPSQLSTNNNPRLRLVRELLDMAKAAMCLARILLLTALLYGDI